MRRFFKEALFITMAIFLISPASAGAVMYSSKKGVGEATQPERFEGYCGSNPTCLQNYWNKVKELGISWIYNWGALAPDHKPAWMTDNSVEYVPMVGNGGSGAGKTYTADELSRSANYASKNPGSHWLIWNEPDLAGLSAPTAASIYDSLRDTITGADPTAKLIVGGIWSNNTRWLNDFRESYKSTHNGVYPDVEGWAGHLYRNKINYTMQSWRTDLYDFRNWMVSIGEGSKEFWLTEFGSLTDYSVGMQIMNDQLGWLEEPAQSWVTRYAWFFAGVYGGAHPGEQGSLFSNSIKDMTVDLSTLGVRYASNPGPPPIYYVCPNYEQNCVNEANACPSGKLYDRLGTCGDGFRCCNPWLPPPTPTPTATTTQTSLKKGAGIVIHPFDACKSQDLNNPCVANFLQKFRSLGISWLYNWGVGKPGWIDNNVEYVPMVGDPGTGPNRSYTQAELNGFSDYAKNNPGSYWLIWNEPDLRGFFPAAAAANVYKPLRDAIISADPKAKFIVGGLANMDTNWVTIFRDTYKQINGVYPPLDGWAFHHYVGGEYNSGSWRYTTGIIRNWLVANGYANKEFWLTEYGSLVSNETGLQIMKDQQEWLEAPEQSWITRYAWFYLGVENAPVDPSQKGNLFTGDLSLSRLDLSWLGKEYAIHPVNSTPTPLTTSTPTPTPTVPACPGGNQENLNCDSGGLINEVDLSILLGAWAPFGPVPTPLPGQRPADLNNDSRVDSSDLSILLSSWNP